jgi:hypothetical protein
LPVREKPGRPPDGRGCQRIRHEFTEYFCSGARGSLAPTVGDVNTATFPERFSEMSQRAWRSLLLNRILLVLAVFVSAATAVIVGFLVYLYLQGYSGGNDPTSVAPLAFLFAIVLYGIIGIPAQLICALLWLAYAASRAARARAR